MLLKSSILATALLAAAPSLAFAGDWNLDASHTHVGFKVRHAMVSKTAGRFSKVTGKLSLDKADGSAGKVEIEIDVASIDTRDDKRDEHLRGADFFDAQKFPTITFRSTKVKKVKGGLEVVGDLTIKGVTKPVTLKVEGPAGPVTDPWGNQRIAFAATTKIDRKAFGVSWNKTLDQGGVMVGDEVEIEIDAELVAAK